MKQPGSVQKSVELKEVIADEVKKIRQRRQVARVANSDEGIEKTLTGLALSGGGVRSASFNLGLVQALDQNGTLRQVDYLSTVSGGGFIGGLISSLAMDEQPGEVSCNSKTNNASKKSKKHDPLTPLAGRDDEIGQPGIVRRLIYSGDYLRSHFAGANRYLIGLVLINLFAVSGMVAVASAFALLTRQLDHPHSVFFLRELGFGNDVSRAFFPSVILGVIWLMAWGVALLSRRLDTQPRSLRVFLLLFIVSILLALASLFGTGDIDLLRFTGILGGKGKPSGEAGESWSTTLIRVLVITPIVVALIPYINPKNLLKSGTDPARGPFERIVFKVCGFAIVIGLPLVVYGWVAQENISGYNELRRKLYVKDIVGWEQARATAPFWLDIEAASTKNKSTNNTTASEDVANEKQFMARARKIVANKIAESKVRFAELETKTADAIGETDKAKLVIDAQCMKGNNIALPQSDCSKWERVVIQQLQLSNKEINQQGVDYSSLQSHIEIKAEAINKREQEIKDPRIVFRWVRAAASLLMWAGNATVKPTGNVTAETNDPSFSAAVKDWHQLHAARSLMVRILDVNMHLEPLLATQDLTGINPESPEEIKVSNLVARMNAAASRHNDLTKTDNKAQSLQSTPDSQRSLARFLDAKDYIWIQNRELLQALFPGALENPKTVYALTVLPADQEFRFRFFCWAFAAFVASGLLVNLNATGMHGYYRDQIARTWIHPCRGYAGKYIPLTLLDTTSKGYPYHLISGTVHFPHFESDEHTAVREHFLFSQEYCGSTRTGFEHSSTFRGGTYDLASAIAISASAVTPARMPNLLAALLCFLLNLRTGQWLPNPKSLGTTLGKIDRLISRWPSPFAVVLGAYRQESDRPFCLITDGGHFENLGILPLLQRRCRLIICSDATYDPTYQFCDFLSLLRQCRIEHGIRFEPLDGNKEVLEEFSQSCEQKSDVLRSRDSYAILRIIYPEAERGIDEREAYLIYIKPTFVKDSKGDFDLEKYRRENPNFPQDPTSDQFFDAEKFECYRQLGYIIGRRIATNCFQDTSLADWQPTPTQPLTAEPAEPEPDLSQPSVFEANADVAKKNRPK